MVDAQQHPVDREKTIRDFNRILQEDAMREKEQGQLDKSYKADQGASEPFPLRACLTNRRTQLLSELRRLDAQIAFVQEHPEIEQLGFAERGGLL